MIEDIKNQLDRIERHLIAEDEISQIGHRIVYDTKTGASINICGCLINPDKLDQNGYQIRL